MTVREAFALSGHPVPEGATIHHESDWTDLRRGWIYHLDGQPFRFTNLPSWGKINSAGVSLPDLSNLPASVFADVLPECVTRVVRP